MNDLNWKAPLVRMRFAQAIQSLCNGAEPPIDFVDSWLDTDCSELQQWAIEYAEHQWMTGISILDAAHDIVEQAYENTNIDAEGCVR